LLKNLDCKAENFLMIGNSIKSDVLPVLELGGTAIHVPYHITWIHEEVSHTIDHPDFYKVKNLGEVYGFGVQKP
jgi:putative hydrolase of the HAD superfamily